MVVVFVCFCVLHSFLVKPKLAWNWIGSLGRFLNLQKSSEYRHELLCLSDSLLKEDISVLFLFFPLANVVLRLRAR